MPEPTNWTERTHADGATFTASEATHAAYAAYLVDRGDLDDAAIDYTEPRSNDDELRAERLAVNLPELSPPSAELPAGATLEPWTDDDTAELAAAMRDAEYQRADRYEEARAGADRMRRVAADVDWSDCDRANGPTNPAERARDGAATTRRRRQEAHANLPTPRDGRGWPILAAAREDGTR